MDSPAAWIVLAYLVGAIPIAYLVCLGKGIDLRKVGSGNIGATNAGRALGRGWGLAVFLGDVLKAWLPTFAAAHHQGLGSAEHHDLIVALVGAAAFLGHVYPVYLRFHGGKGVSVALGITLVFSPAVAGAALVLYLQTLALTRISGLGSLTAVSAMALFVVGADERLPFQLLVLGFAALIYWRHRSNIRELLDQAHDRNSAAGTGPRHADHPAKLPEPGTSSGLIPEVVSADRSKPVPASKRT